MANIWTVNIKYAFTCQSGQENPRAVNRRQALVGKNLWVKLPLKQNL